MKRRSVLYFLLVFTIITNDGVWTHVRLKCTDCTPPVERFHHWAHEGLFHFINQLVQAEIHEELNNKIMSLENEKKMLEVAVTEKTEYSNQLDKLLDLMQHQIVSLSERMEAAICVRYICPPPLFLIECSINGFYWLQQTVPLLSNSLLATTF